MVNFIRKVIINYSIIIVLCFFMSCMNLMAVAQSKTIVNGTVLDSVSSAPLAYTSIAIYSTAEKKLINGNISGDKGDFKIDVPYGKYYAEVNFVGFHPFKTLPF